MDFTCHDHQMLSQFLSQTGLSQISNLDLTSFGLVWSLSFISSFHCIGMCTPLVCAHIQGNSYNKKSILLYNLGRFLSYPILGALCALFGNSITFFSKSAGMVLSGCIGFFLMLSATRLFFKEKPRSNKGSILLAKWLKMITIQTAKLPHLMQSLVLGIFTVFLPCMSLTPMLLFAASSDNPMVGACLLFFFFLGTLPAMVLGPLLLHKSTMYFSPTSQKTALSALLFLTGVLTVLRIFHT